VAPGALEADLQSASEGDVVQGLVFTMICLIIVLGIYLLVFNEYRPGEASYPLPYDNADNYQRQLWAHPRPGSQMQAQHKLASAKSLAGGETLRPASFGMPGTPPTLPGTQTTFGNVGMGHTMPRTDDWHNELPQIYPQLVMPVAHTRLAVPLAFLSTPRFEVDVLGLSGYPLLSAVLSENVGGQASVEISLHSVNTLLAVVTPDLEIIGADNRFFGKLHRDGASMGMGDGPQLALRDREGRPILLLVTTRRDSTGRDFKLSSVTDGIMRERATAVRRPASKVLRGDHYEVVTNPNVDAVLVLAVLLAAVVFESPQRTLAAPVTSGRPSMTTPASVLGLGSVGPP